MCKVCKDSQPKKVAIPFVLRYLTNELAAMNIKLTFLVKWYIFYNYYYYIIKITFINFIKLILVLI